MVRSPKVTLYEDAMLPQVFSGKRFHGFYKIIFQRLGIVFSLRLTAPIPRFVLSPSISIIN